jgi:DNA primase
MAEAVALTKPEKVLFPAAGGHDAITKADVFDYATPIALGTESNGNPVDS